MRWDVNSELGSRGELVVSTTAMCELLKNGLQEWVQSQDGKLSSTATTVEVQMREVSRTILFYVRMRVSVIKKAARTGDPFVNVYSFRLQQVTRTGEDRLRAQIRFLSEELTMINSAMAVLQRRSGRGKGTVNVFNTWGVRPMLRIKRYSSKTSTAKPRSALAS